jgi:hypothetical protein
MKELFYTIACVLTAMIGYTIHGSLFWSIVDFFFAPFAWIKWLVCQEVTLSIIKETFTWFFV